MRLKIREDLLALGLVELGHVGRKKLVYRRVILLLRFAVHPDRHHGSWALIWLDTHAMDPEVPAGRREAELLYRGPVGHTNGRVHADLLELLLDVCHDVDVRSVVLDDERQLLTLVA